MDIRYRGALALCLLSLAACSTLPQSALIYSSRESVGLSVTSNPASASGLTMSIGYDSIDAAYVPVTVANKDKDGSATGGLEHIRGTFSDVDTPKKEANDAMLAKIAAYLDAKQVAESTKSEIADLSSQKAATATLQDQLDETAVKLKKTSLTLDDFPSTRFQLQSTHDKLNKNLSAARAKNQEIDKKIEALTPKLTSAQQDAASKREEAINEAMKLGLVRQDALSVYGRFGGKGDASASGLGLTVGKVFSTGVAAQNLTEGINKHASATAAYAQCLEAAQALSNIPADKLASFKLKCLDLDAAATASAK